MNPEDKQNVISLSQFPQLLRNIVRMNGIVWKEKKLHISIWGSIYLLFSAIPFLRAGLFALLINELVRTAGSPAASHYLLVLAGGLIGVNVFHSMLYSINTYLGRIMWFYLEEKFQLLIIKKNGEIDVAVHENPRYNDLLNKISENGVWRVQNLFERQVYLLQNIMEVCIASVILFNSAWWLFFIILAGTLPELLIEMWYGEAVWNIHSARAEVRRKFWDLKRHFDWIPSLVELKLFQNTTHFFSMIHTLYHSFLDEEKLNDQKKFIRQLAAVTVSELAIGFVTVWFILAVVRGEILIGTFTFLLTSMGSLRVAFSSFFSNLGRQYRDNLYLTDLFEFLSIRPAVTKPSAPHVLPRGKTPEITFDNVSFAYPETEKVVLKNFSLTIPPGEKIALVGINGAGKTTIVKLLCRFYDPTKGAIYVDGKDIKDIDIESWYRQVGALFQDYDHYHFSVQEAIAVGRTEEPPSDSRVRVAAHASESDAFIHKWKNGYEQQLGKEFTGGIEPSIGQWQKLAVARTFYRNPNIFILDEPTSSIDAESEAKIFEKLGSLPKDRSVILISHRFSTVRQAHQICVIDEGTIKEYGTHQELLKKKGMYARLFALQAKGYK
jgi:ABC-type multidrug transport system fused ATPase/permease subunit